MRLIDDETGRELKRGDTVTTFRGEVGTLRDMTEPHKVGSTGRVTFLPEGSAGGEDRGADYYPSVINAHWEA